MQSIDILGCRVDALGAEAARARIVELARGFKPSLVVTLGTEMVMAAQRDERFHAVIDSAALSLCDTVGLLLASRARGGPLRERVTGVELVESLTARSAEDGLRLYFLGGAPGVAEAAARALHGRYPKASIVGARDGYFKEDENEAVAHAVAASGANVLCAGLGSPKQEFWLAAYLPRTGCGVGIGVGGSFDVISGKMQRAPVALRRLGLEWLYRLVREPHRWRRQLALPHFAALALTEALSAATKGRKWNA